MAGISERIVKIKAERKPVSQSFEIKPLHAIILCMDIGKIGEFNLISDISRIIGKPKGDVISGIGDDCAVIKNLRGGHILLTVDTLIEKIHFDLKYFSFYDLGWKSLAANLSDIAAMGGKPLYALVSLGLPKNTKIGSIQEFYKGLKKLGDKFKVAVIGGDTVSSPRGVYISVTLVGEAVKGRYLLRKGAKSGDL
ncbi:MAG: thiamine-phosphate kinase, partial [Candidatus Margulisiibacteriota bacterium]